MNRQACYSIWIEDESLVSDGKDSLKTKPIAPPPQAIEPQKKKEVPHSINNPTLPNSNPSPNPAPKREEKKKKSQIGREEFDYRCLIFTTRGR